MWFEPLAPDMVSPCGSVTLKLFLEVGKGPEANQVCWWKVSLFRSVTANWPTVK